MAERSSTGTRIFNRLLAGLPAPEFHRLSPLLHHTPLKYRQELYRKGEHVRHVYFPGGGICSLVAPLADGSTVELAMVGREGVVGATAPSRPHQLSPRPHDHSQAQSARVGVLRVLPRRRPRVSDARAGDGGPLSLPGGAQARPGWATSVSDRTDFAHTDPVSLRTPSFRRGGFRADRQHDRTH